MKLWLVWRQETGQCPAVETSRLTASEADAYCVNQETLAAAEGDDTIWYSEEIDMPLSAESPAIMAEAVTSA
jgi:hypothetical protein